jgi:hypothetical protein
MDVMISRGFGSISEVEQESGSLLVRITRLPTERTTKERAKTVLPAREEEECRRYGYRTRVSIYITGGTEKRATNIVLLNGIRIPIGDVPFALFLRLVVELSRNKKGTVPRSRLVKGGYIRADGEYQAIARLRQAFSTALDHHKPEEFIESCERRALRLSTHPCLIAYDKARLLGHRNQKIRRLAQRLP